MTPLTSHINTRTGGHSAKNAHRSGAPYPQQTSGEAPMVGNEYSPGAFDANGLVAGMPGGGKTTAVPALVWQLAVELTQVRAELAELWHLVKEQTRSVR